MTDAALPSMPNSPGSDPALDLDFVRSQFPAFAEESWQGWAFFENAGGSFPCRQVIRRLTEFYTRTKVQPYGPYPAARRAGEWMDEAYARIAECLGVSPDAVMFGPSTTQNVYVLATALAETLRAGDEIVVTDQDHEANGGAWRRLAERGARVREWRVDLETGHLDPDDLRGLLSERTRLVAFPHCSNIVAEINPVAEICEMVREAGALSVVDGVSYAPHGLPDVAALGADVYMFSAYKTYGPHLGVMAVQPSVLERLPNQSHWFNAGKPRTHLVPAGPDHAQIAAAAGIAEYQDALYTAHFTSNLAADGRAARVRRLMRAAEIRLAAPLLDFLRGRNDLRVLGPTDAERRAPTVSILHRRPGRDLAEALARHRIACDGGTFYARRVCEAMGVEDSHGVLRVSFLHYTSDEDIARLIAALDRVL